VLDGIGLKKRDAEGFRVRTDNGERLRVQIDVPQTLSPTWPQQAEMIVQQWRAIGIAADMRLLERNLFIYGCATTRTRWCDSATTARRAFVSTPCQCCRWIRREASAVPLMRSGTRPTAPPASRQPTRCC
jgi:hypothetical protein